MIIKQLSVFLENKTGRINDVVHTLGANGMLSVWLRQPISVFCD